MENICRVCSVPLVIGENITKAQRKHNGRLCTLCSRKKTRVYYHKHQDRLNIYRNKLNHCNGVCQPIGKNKNCPTYTNVCVSKKVIAHIFPNTKQIHGNNHGYGVLCVDGTKVSVKTSCREINGKTFRWRFAIRKNHITDYFLLVALDNREDMNIEHVWIVPGDKVNMFVGTSITTSNLQKWDDYRIDMDRIDSCCNVLKEGDKQFI